MNSNLQKSVEEDLERLLRALLNTDYFENLSCDDRVDIIMSLFDYLLSNCKQAPGGASPQAINY